MLGFLFSPVGRVSRKGYWLGWILPSAALGVIATVIDTATGNAGTGVVSTIATLVTVWPNIAVTVKRYHDRGMSGWWVLWSVLIVIALAIPLVAASAQFNLTNIVWPWMAAWVSLYAVAFAVTAFALIVYFLPGDIGANRFGADPLGPRKAKKPRKDPAQEFPGPWTAPLKRTDLPSTDSPSRTTRRPPRWK
ncbi:MAG: DUF805 domain-containing protein [Hyphomonadaceae bacterium]|nr:DUF805 domain-containing protein [Hyphomonadaceae bacterium]